MNKIGLAMLAVALLACSKDSSPGAGSASAEGSAGSADDDYTGTPECDAALMKWMDAAKAASREQIEARIGSAAPEVKERLERGLERGEKMMKKVKVALSKRCTEDHWASDVLDCMKAITDRKEIFACLDKLPPDQQERAKTDANAARTGRRAGSGMPPGMGRHALGGPMGSNGSVPAAPVMVPAPGSAATPAAGSAAAAPAGSATTPAGSAK